MGKDEAWIEVYHIEDEAAIEVTNWGELTNNELHQLINCCEALLGQLKEEEAKRK